MLYPRYECGAGIIFNTRNINPVIAKNCNRYCADTHIVAMQFCGNLPLLTAELIRNITTRKRVIQR